MGETKGVCTRAMAIIALAAGRKVLGSDRLAKWSQIQNVDTAIFSYKNDFALLWGLDKDGSGLKRMAEQLAIFRQNNNYTLVIIWDGMPEDVLGDVVSTGRYVTPYDWAVAISVALYRINHLDKKLQPKIRILILNTGFKQGRKSFTQKAFFSFHNAFPWIQDYALVSTGDDVLVEAAIDDTDCEAYSWLRQAIPPRRRDTERLIRDIIQPECILTTFAENSEGGNGLEPVIESWRQQFLKPGDRHSIANLLAPYLLASGLPENIRSTAQILIDKNSLPRQALREILELIGLLSVDAKRKRGHELCSLEDGGGVFGRRSSVNFLLIDDLFESGFHHILGFTLFDDRYNPDRSEKSESQWQFNVKGQATITCTANAEKLINVLHNCHPVRDWNLPRILNVPECDILLLDLRIWSEGQNDIRSRFMKSVVVACTHLNADKINDPNFQRAFNAAVKLAEGEDTSELPALALLVLLISHYDPSLPVVLFSSTHQRELLEMVSHRENIITIFSKPVLNGYDREQMPDQMIENLRMALCKALDLHEMRLIWQRLINVDWKGNLECSEGEGISHKITGDSLRVRLARMYTGYLITGRYYDFISLPYELLEGALEDNYTLRYTRRNAVAHALKALRHRKAHGYQRPQAQNEMKIWRNCAVVEFLLLLDFVERKSSFSDGLRSEIDGLLSVCWQSLDLNEYDRKKLTSPNTLISISEIPWQKFFMCTVLHWVKQSCAKEDKAMVSYATVEALAALSEIQCKCLGDVNKKGLKG